MINPISRNQGSTKQRKDDASKKCSATCNNNLISGNQFIEHCCSLKKLTYHILLLEKGNFLIFMKFCDSKLICFESIKTKFSLMLFRIQNNL